MSSWCTASQHRPPLLRHLFLAAASLSCHVVATVELNDRTLVQNALRAGFSTMRLSNSTADIDANATAVYVTVNAQLRKRLDAWLAMIFSNDHKDCAKETAVMLKELRYAYTRRKVPEVLHDECEHFRRDGTFGADREVCHAIAANLIRTWQGDQDYETWCRDVYSKRHTAESADEVPVQKNPGPRTGQYADVEEFSFPNTANPEVPCHGAKPCDSNSNTRLVTDGEPEPGRPHVEPNSASEGQQLTLARHITNGQGNHEHGAAEHYIMEVEQQHTHQKQRELQAPSAAPKAERHVLAKNALDHTSNGEEAVAEHAVEHEPTATKVTAKQDAHHGQNPAEVNQKRKKVTEMPLSSSNSTLSDRVPIGTIDSWGAASVATSGPDNAAAGFQPKSSLKAVKRHGPVSYRTKTSNSMFFTLTS
eukprot:gnl/TRDRNA2_/TRDRNA2_194488_c0_seq1.p1 gnl/TRDRNA2_/TRDRNA2_194488_c0~~gnl/TRDRNA2_/TRDRNA2_194488_c0_seq1.p1  ORF type:complete len:420 (+),score=52.49 gnl/TRDRNA2_/TRDRNA2_194488_c0_seq1:64-1323(+)